MKVELAGDRLLSMSKDLPADRVAGENVGMLSFGAETVQALFREGQSLLAEEGGERQWLGSAVCRVARERTLRAVDVRDLPWGEVDFPYDLDHVRKKVWPEIQRASSRRLIGKRLAACLGVMLVAAMLIGGNMLGTREALAWESVDFENVERVEIQAGDRAQNWLLVAADQVARTEVNGPCEVCVDTRLIVPEDAGADDPVPYVLDLRLDGVLVDWFKQSTRASSTWRYDSATIGKRRRITLDVPEGRHTLDIRLVASSSGPCLLRVRQEIEDDAEE